MESRATSFLILGPSGGGKTVAAAMLCKQLGNPVLLFNAVESDYKKWAPHLSMKRANWGELFPKSERKKTYVIEDVTTALKPDQKGKLFSLLNFDSRHLSCPILLISHSVHSNGVYSLLDFMTHVILTCDPINLRMLRELLKRFFYTNVDEVETCFSSLPSRHYLQLLPHQRKFMILDSQLQVLQDIKKIESLEPIKKEKILSIFSHFPNRELYGNLWDFLMSILDPSFINPKDLSVRVTTFTGDSFNVSLLDYMYTLGEPDLAPPKSIVLLHRFLCKSCCFPILFIRNQVLLSHRHHVMS